MRILLVDDHALFRDGVALLLKELDPAVQTVHAAHLGEALAALDHDTGIDLVLLDLILPGANGFQALETIRERHPGMPLVMLSSQEDQVTVLRAIQLGAMGFIPKSSNAETLGIALRRVLDGDRWVPDVALSAPAASADEHDIAARVRELTPQQFRVLQMLGSGKLNKQIGYELGVSEATIKAHMSAILRKLRASNRTQAVLMAGKLAVDPDDVVAPDGDGD